MNCTTYLGCYSLYLTPSGHAIPIIRNWYCMAPAITIKCKCCAVIIFQKLLIWGSILYILYICQKNVIFSSQLRFYFFWGILCQLVVTFFLLCAYWTDFYHNLGITWPPCVKYCQKVHWTATLRSAPATPSDEDCPPFDFLVFLGWSLLWEELELLGLAMATSTSHCYKSHLITHS